MASRCLACTLDARPAPSGLLIYWPLRRDTLRFFPLDIWGSPSRRTTVRERVLALGGGRSRKAVARPPILNTTGRYSGTRTFGTGAASGNG